MIQVLSRITKWVFVALSSCAFVLIGCVAIETEQQAEITTTRPTIVTTTHLGGMTSPTPEEVVLTTATLKPSPTMVASSTFTPDATQMATAAMLPSPTRVLTPTATPTITPLPTLSIVEEGDFLSMLMANNGGCDLPCWWGVVPGETTSQEGRDMFVSLGVDDWSVAFDNTYATMGLGYPIQNNLHSRDVTVRFELKNDVIQYIRMEAAYKHEDSRTIFRQDWSHYKLSAILDRYGVPSHVRLFHIPNSPYYQLGVSYISLGIEIRYVILPESFESRRVCADMERTDFIYLTLFPPERADEIPGIAPNLDSYDMESWSSVTGLDVESFYNIFIEDAACIETE
jgi:hypothetical protein